MVARKDSHFLTRDGKALFLGILDSVQGDFSYGSRGRRSAVAEKGHFAKSDRQTHVENQGDS